jgi:hypothetical protein
MKIGFIDDTVAIVLGAVATLYLLVVLGQAILKYKSFGLWFTLLIGIEIGLVSFTCG